MTPDAMLRLRRTTAVAAVCWAVSALVLSLAGQFTARGSLTPPVQTSGTGGVVVVHWVHESAAAAGIAVGDRVIAVDDVPIHDWFRDRGWEGLEGGVPVRYRVVDETGAEADIGLLPVARSETTQRFFVPLFGATLLVGFSYLGLGLLVWRLRPDRNESWAFLLFGSVMAVQLFCAVHTYDALWGYERMLANLPFIGATTFHLFTTFPAEPPWVVRFPHLRAAVYSVAAFAAGVALLEGALGVPHSVPIAISYASALLGAAFAVGVLTREWIRARGTVDSSRVDVIFLGATLSFVPVIVGVLAQQFFKVIFPMSLLLIWFVVMPAAVAWGIVRNQLFDIRGLASTLR